MTFNHELLLRTIQQFINNSQREGLMSDRELFRETVCEIVNDFHASIFILLIGFFDVFWFPFALFIDAVPLAFAGQ